MLGKLFFLFIIIGIQACTSHKDTEVLNFQKPDYSKAALYNIQLGLGYLEQGDRPRAKKKLLMALKQEPNSPDVHSALAYFFEQTKELDKASEYYLKALSLSSNPGPQYNNYGTFLCKKGQYKKSLIYFLKAAKDVQYINTAGAYENAGLCALLDSDKDKARLYFRKVLEQDPSKIVSLYELVKLEMDSGDQLKAFALIKSHPDLVLNDSTLLPLAKKLAQKLGDARLVQEYQAQAKRLGIILE